ncbi:MAG: oligosaccharide flippase family protein [Pseudomonadaceae bacterium]|nr:oligosaccharide flippase family protein [Pseudomonadaceae bacterium]
MEKSLFAWLDLRDLVKPIAGVGLLKISSLAFTTIASIIVARQLGPAAYGQVTFVLAVMSLLSIPSNNAMGPLLVREVSVHEQAGRWSILSGLLSWSRKVTAGAVLVILFPLTIGATVVFTRNQSIDAMLFVIAAPLLVAWALAGRVSNTLLGLQRTVLAQFFDWFAHPAIYLLCIGTLWYFQSLGPATVLGSTLFALAFATLVGYLVLQNNLPADIRSVEKEFLQRDWISSWRYFIFLQLISVANLRAPILFMGLLSNETEIGLYRVAENITSMVAVSFLIINIVLGPYVSRLHASGQLEELGRIARSAARIALGVTLPAAFVIGLFGEWVIVFLFGVEYEDAALPLALLLISQVLNVACGSVGLILNMAGLEKRALRSWFIALVVNILACTVLIPVYGALGAAVAIGASTIVWNISLLNLIRKLLGINVAAV